MPFNSKRRILLFLMSALLVSSAVVVVTDWDTVAGSESKELNTYPSSAKLWRTAGTTKIDSGWTAAKTSAKDCGFGTCDNTDSWNAGARGQSSGKVNVELILSYDLSGTGVDATTIRNIEFNFGGCWHGGQGRSCGDTSNIEFKSEGTAAVSMWDGEAWEQIGLTIKIGNKSSSSLDSYKEFKRVKSANFDAGHLTGDVLKMKIKTTGITISDHDVIQVLDYARLTIGYEVDGNGQNSPPVADASKTQFVKEGSTVVLDASASHDPGGDVLSFHWSQVAGSPVAIQDSDEPMASFIAPQVSDPAGLAFRVSVADQESSSTDEVAVVVKEAVLSKPNVLIFLTDDQRWDTIDYMPTVRDRIAGEGALFTNAFASLPLCCPARATILTGQYAHNHNVWKNVTPLGGMPKFNDDSSIATWLENEGYRTGIIGKYMNSYTTLIPYVAKGWDTWNVIQEVYYYNYTMVDDGVVLRYGDDPEDYLTDVIRDRAIDFLQSGDGEPFLLYVGFPAPHTDILARYPLMPPRHEGTCEQLAPWRPPSYNETNTGDKPMFLNYLKPIDEPTRQYIDKFRNDQICSLKATDEAIAAIMDEIGPELDNTLVIFLSDNGFFWGEHRMQGKFEMYEEAIRIPLAIRYPPLVDPQVRDELVVNIDIAPTISEIADAPPYPKMKVDGTSLSELFVIGNEYWRDQVLIEQIRYGNQSGIRTANFKYIESLWDMDGVMYFELYDLRTDPYEMKNVASDPSYSAIRADLARRLAEMKDD